MSRMTFGRRVLGLREEKNWTQKETAQKIGIDASQLNRIENEKSQNVGSETLARMAAVFDVSADYLLGLSEYRQLKTAPVAKIGLSEEAVILLMKKQIDPELLSRMMEHEDFSYLMRLVRAYVHDAHEQEADAANDLYRYAYQQLRQVDVANPEMRQERNDDLVRLRARVNSNKRATPTLDEIMAVFETILKDVRKDMQKGKPASAPLTTKETIADITAQLPMDKPEEIKVDDVGSATWEMVADRMSMEPGKNRERFKKVFLWLFKGMARISGGKQNGRG